MSVSFQAIAAIQMNADARAKLSAYFEKALAKGDLDEEGVKHTTLVIDLLKGDQDAVCFMNVGGEDFIQISIGDAILDFRPNAKGGMDSAIRFVAETGSPAAMAGATVQ